MIDVNRRVLPGFGLSLGYTMLYLSLLVAHPDGGRASSRRRRSRSTSSGPRRCPTARSPPTGSRCGPPSSSRRSSTSSLGVLVAWVLVRYEFPLQAALRLAGRLAVRAADGRRRAGLLEPLRRERLVRPVPRAARHRGRVLAARHRAGAGLHRLPVRRPHAAAGAREPRARRRGGGGLPRRQPPADRSCA